MFKRKTCREGHLMDPSWKICPICLAPVRGWFVTLSGINKNKVFTFHEGKTKIGLGVDCELRIRMESISRHHALLMAKEGKYMISDLNSISGTYVNNYQITSREIIDGDIIRLGEVEFKFKCI